jgi:hypothetical protein
MAKYKTYFAKARFSPRDIGIPGYTVLYTLFGFARTERWIHALVKLRDQ